MIKNKKLLIIYSYSIFAALIAIGVGFFMLPSEKDVLLLRSQQEKATQLFENSYSEGNTSPYIVNSLLTLYDRDGESEKTIRLLIAEIENNPNNIENYIELANIYKKIGLPASQMHTLEEIALKTNNANILNEYSYLCHDFQMYDKEKQVLERMLTYSKSNKEAVIRLAYLYYNDSQFEKAVDLMRGFNFSNFPEEVTDRFYISETLAIDFYALSLANIGEFDAMNDIVDEWVIPYERETIITNLVAYLSSSGYLKESNDLLKKYRKSFELDEILFNALISGLTQVYEYKEAYDLIKERQPDIDEMTIIELNNFIRVLMFLNDRSEEFTDAFKNLNVMYIDEVDLLAAVDILDSIGRRDIIEKINNQIGSRYLLLRSKIFYLLENNESSKKYLNLVMQNTSLALWQRIAIIDILTKLGEVEKAQNYTLKTISENSADLFLINQYLNYCDLNEIQQKCISNIDRLSTPKNKFLMSLLKINLYFSMNQYKNANTFAISLKDVEFSDLLSDRTFEKAYKNNLTDIMFLLSYKMMLTDPSTTNIAFMTGTLQQMAKRTAALRKEAVWLNEEIFAKDEALDELDWQKVLEDNFNGVLKNNKDSFRKYAYIIQKLTFADTEFTKENVILTLKERLTEILSYEGYNAYTFPKKSLEAVLYLGYKDEVLEFVQEKMDDNPKDWQNLYLDILILANQEDKATSYIKSVLDNPKIDFVEKEVLVYRMLQENEIDIIMPLLKYMAEKYYSDWAILYVVNLQNYNLTKEINSYLDTIKDIDKLSPTNQQLLGYIYLNQFRKKDAEKIFMRLANDETSPDMINTSQLLFLWGSRPNKAQADWIMKKAKLPNKAEAKKQWLEALLYIRKPQAVLDIINKEMPKGIDFVLLSARALEIQKNKKRLNNLLSKQVIIENDSKDLYKLGLLAREFYLPEFEVKFLEKAYKNTQGKKNKDLVLELAQAYFNSQDYINSKKILEENKNIVADNYRGYYILGSIAYAEEKRENSKIYYLKSAKLYSTITDNSLDDRIHYGYSLFRSGDIYGGSDEFDKLMIDYPNNNYVKESYYNLLIENGAIEKAKRIFNK